MKRSTRVVVIGSINQDLVLGCERLPVPGETVIANDFREIPGGKGANQAVAAARAGGQVQMVARLGDDHHATTLRQTLVDEGIDTTHVAATRNCTSGLAVVTVEASGQNAILVVPGANGQLSPADVVAAQSIIDEADVVLLQLEVPIETVIAAIELARRMNVMVILDPAPCPSGEIDPRLLQVDLICPNQSEAQRLVGFAVEDSSSARRAIEVLVSFGCRYVIITMGGAGAMVGDGKSVISIAPHVVDVVDTTAAGDAFAGALAVRWIEWMNTTDDSPLECLCRAAQFANVAGALAASSSGAIPSLPKRERIEAIVKTVSETLQT